MLDILSLTMYMCICTDNVIFMASYMLEQLLLVSFYGFLMFVSCHVK